MTHDLAAPYALGALTDTERRRFERHLTRCPACADEAAGLRKTTTMLALAVARRPPAELRERVMAEIARTRQSPPPIPRRLPSARGLSWLAAAACLVLTLLSSGAAWHFHRSAENAQALNHQITAVMTAPDAHTSTAHAQGDATITVISSRSLNKAVVTTSRLRPLTTAKTYQMWWLGPTLPRSAGTLNPPNKAHPVITTGLGNAQHFAITVEPTPGSDHPTNTPLLTLPLN